MTEPDAQSFLPLSTPMFHVLLALGSDSLHGYAIMQRLDSETNGQDTLLPGTLYATVAKMLEAGLVMEVEAPGADGDRRRRYYRVSALGREVAAAESRRMERLLALARKSRLAATGSRP